MAAERHYVIASQVVTVLLMIFSLVVTYYLDSIEYAWKLLDGDRRRHGHGAAAALVLVANQRLVGSVGDGCRRGRVALFAALSEMEQR